MMQGLTRQIAEFITSAPRLELNEAVQSTVRSGFIDTVGVMLAGRQEPVTTIVRQFVAAKCGHLAQARVLWEDNRVSTRDAALINATAGHALDYDDVGLMGHPSVVLVPALLAEGEYRAASGQQLMRAYVVGYEIWAELITRDQDRHHVKGWHPTAVFGVLAVTGAVAALRGLDVQQSQNAMGIAASMASGILANFGSMTKPFHAGQAAANGIDAVDLAEAGMTASPDALEHHAGLLVAISPQGSVDRSPCQVPLGRELRIATMGLTIKKYPMCFATHRILDGVLDLVHRHDLSEKNVRAIHATIGTTQASMLRNHRPRTALEAKFSLEFAVAAPVLLRKVGLTELQDEVVLRPEIQALFEKVHITMVDTVCPSEPTLSLSDRVCIETDTGIVLDSGEIFETRGGISSPLSTQEMREKFLDCASAAPYVDANALFDQLYGLPQLQNMAAFD
jgi:2-methylcitrate dehydratase PrpD